MTALGVLCCFALFVCLTLLASFFLPSHLSLKTCIGIIPSQLRWLGGLLGNEQFTGYPELYSSYRFLKPVNATLMDDSVMVDGVTPPGQRVESTLHMSHV